MKEGNQMDGNHVNTAFRSNVKLARVLWGNLSKIALDGLKALTARYSVSVAAGDIQLVDGRWYVTHAGLLQIAQRNRCSGMRTTVEKELSDPASNRWVFRATVYKSPRSRGFVGYGDADPSNVSSLVDGASFGNTHLGAVDQGGDVGGIGIPVADEAS